MRTSTLVLVSVVLLVCAAPSGALARMAQDKVNVFDGFFAPAQGTPAAFKDIHLISVANPGHNNSADRTAPYPYGWIELKGARQPRFPLLKPTLEGKNLSFKTRVVRGVSYEFSGTLPKIEYESLDEINSAPVLTGTLKKLQAGKVIAEGKVPFGWFAGD